MADSWDELPKKCGYFDTDLVLKDDLERAHSWQSPENPQYEQAMIRL
jgi:hypothetical protein